VRHAPLQALRCAQTSAAPKGRKYKDLLKKALTRIVFVPVFFFIRERYTTQSLAWLKIFV
jgi:hypothetical protein